MRRWAALVIVWGLGAVSGSMVGWTSALFSSTTSNPGNTFAAAADFGCSSPGSQTIPTTRDSYVDEDQPGTNFGSNSNLVVQSQNGARDQRTLVYFALIPPPSGCVISSATLRLYATFVHSGRNILAYRVGLSWTESGVSWTNQPATVGSPATASSGSAVGWKEWNVTAQVEQMYATSNNGFLLKDQTEDESPAKNQIYQSREGSPNDPQLVVTFGDAVCSSPGTQTVTSTADSLVAEATPTTNYGTDPTNFGIRSLLGGNARSLIRFDLPSVPSNCSVTAATLRGYASSAATGRTLEAIRLAAAWTELGVNWTNQPGTTGAAATKSSIVGWVEWDVVSQVQAMYSGTNNGFLIRDAAENAVSAQDQSMHPRENTNDPQLVVTFA
jgi:hypothetical protein